MERQNFNQIVIGINEYDEIVTLDNIHEYGASGYVFSVVDLMTVNHTVKSFFEFINDVYPTEMTDVEKQHWVALAMEDFEFPGQDTSHREYWEDIMKTADIDPEMYTLNCIGCGSCFDINMNWKRLINPELWELIKVAVGR